MDRSSATAFTITCEGCGRRWSVAPRLSVYQQQAIESCPCPQCGAYTLCCHAAAEVASSRPHGRADFPPVSALT